MERMKVIGRMEAYLLAFPIVGQSDFSSGNQIFQIFVNYELWILPSRRGGSFLEKTLGTPPLPLPPSKIDKTPPGP